MENSKPTMPSRGLILALIVSIPFWILIIMTGISFPGLMLIIVAGAGILIAASRRAAIVPEEVQVDRT